MTKRRTYTKEFKIEAVELADVDRQEDASGKEGSPHTSS